MDAGTNAQPQERLRDAMTILSVPRAYNPRQHASTPTTSQAHTAGQDRRAKCKSQKNEIHGKPHPREERARVREVQVAEKRYTRRYTRLI
jgi:hypothetical protein